MIWKALPLAAGLAGSALALSTLTAPQDYESMPPGAAEMHAAASALAPLERAVAVAAQDTGGKAFGARLQDGNAWVVDCATATARFEVVIGKDGAVQSKREVPRFPGEPATGEPVELEGLQYIILREGNGPKPAGPTSTVKVHYSGYLTDGTKFDSSFDRSEPTSFPLNRVIRGWTVGVGDMKIGEKRKLIIPFAMAYGATGRPPVIPARATLIFDVELLEITD